MYQCAMGKRSTSTMAKPLISQCLRKLSSQDGGAHKQDYGVSPSKHKSPNPISTPSSSTEQQDRNLSNPCTMLRHQRRYWSRLRCATPTQIHIHQRKQFTTSKSCPALNTLSATSMEQQGSQQNLLGSRALATGTT